MCFTAEQRAAYAPKLGLAADVTDDVFRDKLLTEYDATAPVVAHTAAVAQLLSGYDGETIAERTSAALADRDEAREEVASLSAALADAKKEVLSLSAAASPRVIDPEALRDRAANYRDKLALMVDRGQISNDVAQRVVALGLTDEKPSGLMLTGAVDLGGKRPAEVIIGLLDGMTPVQTNNAVTRAAGVAPPPQFPSRDPLSLSGAGGKQDLTPAEQAVVDESLARTELGRRALASRPENRQHAGAGA